MNLYELLEQIQPEDQTAKQAAQKQWDSIAKPLGSLGKLESTITGIAGVTGNANVQIDKRAVIVMCADNGVVKEGVTQTGQEVTAIMAEHIAKGKASVSKMSKIAKTDVFAIDIGMAVRVDGVRDCHIASGTNNIAEGPAMTREEAERAIMVGIQLVKEYKEKGYAILATGEMGIGNTTSSSAITAALLSIPVEEVTGRGAGLSDVRLEKKIQVIKKAIALNNPNRDDAIDVLAKVGGYDIAGMAGIFLGGALYRVPIVIDGLISSVAALVALKICKNAACAMLASHESAEPAAKMLFEALPIKPILSADMRLGEGTGAVCLFPLLDMALAVYNGTTYEDVGIEAYTPQGEGK